MSLRTFFREVEMAELRRRLDRLPMRTADQWLEDFPELWLQRGSRWRAAPEAEAGAPFAIGGDGVRCAHLFEPLRGEPGAWSYLCASFLYGALLAESCGRTWLMEPPGPALLRLIEQAQDLPSDWRPCVIEDNTRISVRWYSAQPEQLWAHEDIYRSEGFELERTRRLFGRQKDC